MLFESGKTNPPLAKTPTIINPKYIWKSGLFNTTPPCYIEISHNLLIRCFIFFQHELSTFVCERQQLIHFYCYGRLFATALPRLLTSWKRRDRRSGVINTLSGTLNTATKAPNLERRHTVSEITDIKGNYYILCKRILLSFLRLESL